MKDVGTLTIETQRLYLRKLTMNDAPFIYKNWANDPLVVKYLTWNVHKSIEDSLKYVEYKINKYKDGYNYDWLIVLKENNVPIGEIDACNVSLMDDSIEIGYCLGFKYWNNGYMSEALTAVIKYLFEVADVSFIYARFISLNIASGKVMEKANMKYNSTIKDFYLDKSSNERVDAIYCSIRKNDE